MKSAIKLIINGYYRTGTTILARIIKLSNPEIIVLHEPTSVILCHELRKWRRGTPHPLHGFDVYEDYFELGEDFISELCKVWREYSFIREPHMVIKIVDFINNYCLRTGRQTVLKLNQAFLCLSTLAEKFNTIVIHIYRDPAETLYDQVFPEWQNDLHAVEEALLRGNEKYLHIIGFWLDPLYEELSRTVPVKEVAACGKVYRFLIVYLTLNTIAVKLCEQTDKCVVVRFEDIVDKPHLFKKLIESRTDLKIRDDHLQILKRSKAIKAPDFLRKAVKEAMQFLELREPDIPPLEEIVNR